MKERSGVLFVSPHHEDAQYLSLILKPLEIRLTHVPDAEEARACLARYRYDVVLTEAALPDGEWLDVLRLARQHSPGCEVIVTDPLADGRFWAEAINLGAYDLLAQPFYESEVRRILSNACQRSAAAAA